MFSKRSQDRNLVPVVPALEKNSEDADVADVRRYFKPVAFSAKAAVQQLLRHRPIILALIG